MPVVDFFNVRKFKNDFFSLPFYLQYEILKCLTSDELNSLVLQKISGSLMGHPGMIKVEEKLLQASWVALCVLLNQSFDDEYDQMNQMRALKNMDSKQLNWIQNHNKTQEFNRLLFQLLKLVNKPSILVDNIYLKYISKLEIINHYYPVFQMDERTIEFLSDYAELNSKNLLQFDVKFKTLFPFVPSSSFMWIENSIQQRPDIFNPKLKQIKIPNKQIHQHYFNVIYEMIVGGENIVDIKTYFIQMYYFSIEKFYVLLRNFILNGSLNSKFQDIVCYQILKQIKKTEYNSITSESDLNGLFYVLNASTKYVTKTSLNLIYWSAIEKFHVYQYNAVDIFSIKLGMNLLMQINNLESEMFYFSALSQLWKYFFKQSIYCFRSVSDTNIDFFLEKFFLIKENIYDTFQSLIKKCHSYQFFPKKMMSVLLVIFSKIDENNHLYFHDLDIFLELISSLLPFVDSFYVDTAYHLALKKIMDDYPPFNFNLNLSLKLLMILSPYLNEVQSQKTIELLYTIFWGVPMYFPHDFDSPVTKYILFIFNRMDEIFRESPFSYSLYGDRWIFFLLLLNKIAHQLTDQQIEILVLSFNALDAEEHNELSMKFLGFPLEKYLKTFLLNHSHRIRPEVIEKIVQRLQIYLTFPMSPENFKIIIYAHFMINCLQQRLNNDQLNFVINYWKQYLLFLNMSLLYARNAALIFYLIEFISKLPPFILSIDFFDSVLHKAAEICHVVHVNQDVFILEKRDCLSVYFKVLLFHMNQLSPSEFTMVLLMKYIDVLYHPDTNDCYKNIAFEAALHLMIHRSFEQLQLPMANHYIHHVFEKIFSALSLIHEEQNNHQAMSY